MKDNQEYILFKTLELRHSPHLEHRKRLNKLQEGTHRSFIVQFNNNFDRISILIHFKHLGIHNLTLHYRKKSSSNRKTKKVYPQHKMNLSFENTLELLTYLSSKSYKIDWLEITFENGWAIKAIFFGVQFITNTVKERNQLFEKKMTVNLINKRPF